MYAASQVLSLMRTRIAVAKVTAFSNDTTLISIPSLRTGWRAGQHVRLRIPKLSLESHPFTIASSPDGAGMVLLCKAAGGWTNELHKYAQRGQEQEATITVMLEGPYGGLGNTLIHSFSAITLIAGGSGITHALSLAHSLVLRAPSGVVRARTVDLVWILRTEEYASPFLPTLMSLVKDAKAYEKECLSPSSNPGHPPPMALRVRIYLSRSSLNSVLPIIDPATALAAAAMSRRPSTMALISILDSSDTSPARSALSSRRGLLSTPFWPTRRRWTFWTRHLQLHIPIEHCHTSRSTAVNLISICSLMISATR